MATTSMSHLSPSCADRLGLVSVLLRIPAGIVRGDAASAHARGALEPRSGHGVA